MPVQHFEIDRNCILPFTAKKNFEYAFLQEYPDTAFKKKQMHSGCWGLSRETINLLYLRHNHFYFGIFFCLIPLPIPQCIAISSNAISSITT